MWKVISFHTPDYRDVVSRLVNSLNTFEIPHSIQEVKCKGFWKENTFYKIPFIIKKLKESKHPLVWLDADAEVMKYPRIFDKLPMSNHLMAGIYSPLRSVEFVSNTMYFVPSKEVFGYLREVQKFIEDVPRAYDSKLVGEQFYMQKVLEANQWKERLRFLTLPYSYGMPSYWKRCDYYHLYKFPPVIMQRQASRSKDPIKKKLYESKGLSLKD